MLDQRHRFHGLNSLTHVYRQGQTVHGALLTLKYNRNPRRQQFRVAVVVSRKVDKSAVVRNRIRRRVYAVVAEQAAAITDPYDLVFTVFTPQLAELEYPKLRRLVAQTLKKAGVMTPVKPLHAIVNPEE